MIRGRDAEVAQATAELARPNGRGVLLVGTPGMGRSALAHAIVEVVAPQHTVLWVRASPSTTDVPLGAFGPFLPANAATLGLPAILHLRDALRARADADRPLLLVVDDAQHLDEASSGLVHQLVLLGDARVLVTIRAAAPAPEAVRRLWREHLLQRIDLEPLERQAVAAITADLVAGRGAVAWDDSTHIDPATVHDLWERSAGNPLLLREIVLAAVDADEWVSGPAGVRVEARSATAPRLVDLLGDRLAHLDDAQRDLLTHLAFGEPLGYGEIVALGSDTDLDALERAGIIVADLDQRRLTVRIAQPLLAEVLRRSVGNLRARAIRVTLMNVLRATGARRRTDEMRLAALAAEAGMELEPDVLTRAARTALFANDVALAMVLAESAFAQQPSFESGHVLADARYEDGGTDGIDRHWEAWSATADTDERRALIAMHQAIVHFYRLADADGAFAVLDRIEAELSPGPSLSEVRGLRATLLMMGGRTREALDIALPLVESSELGRVFVQASLAATQSLRALGRHQQALDLDQRVSEAFAVLGDAATLFTSTVFGTGRGPIHLPAGRIQLAIDVGTAARDAAVAAGEVSAEGLAELGRADALMHVLRFADATAAARAAESAFSRVNHVGWRRWAISQRALAACLVEQIDAAERALDELDRLHDHPCHLFDHVADMARALVDHTRGNTPGAIDRLQAAAVRAAERGEIDGAVRARYEIVRMGGEVLATAPQAAELAALVEGTDGDLFPAMVAHARALENGDLAELESVAERLATMGSLLHAVRAASHAADLAEAADDQRTAARWRRVVGEWMATGQSLAGDPLGSPTVVGGEGAPQIQVPLTKREREVALLASQGLPARSIGERLFLSARTVENHLAKAYAKLGVRNRAELAHLLATAAA